MIASERRRAILKVLYRDGIINLHDIARQLNVAEITIRRDFEKLEADGKLKRVQGGAASLDDSESAELTMTQKLPIHISEKETIAEFADTLVKDGDCVFIDAGTTALPLASRLVKRKVHIITYNTLILEKMNKSNARLFIIGGEYLPYYNMNVGLIAQEALKQFYFNIAFVGCSGVDAKNQMVYTTETESLQMKKIAMQNSEQKILLADNHKLESRGLLKIGSSQLFDKVIINKSDDFTQEYPENFVFAE